MHKRLKTVLSKIFSRLGSGARGGARPLPDMAPDAGPSDRCVSTGLHFEALEPRLLLSATGESAAIGAAITTPQPAEHVQFDSQNQALSTDLLHALENREGSHSAESQAVTHQSGNATQPETSASAANTANAAAAGFGTDAALANYLEPVDLLANADNQELDTISLRHELVVVDGGITNYEQLVADLLSDRDDSRQLEVVILDPDGDGVAQVSDLLAERQDLDALHLVSHGTDRGVKLGDTWIYPENLTDYAGNIATWQASLAEGADLLFYGCNFAATGDGQALLAAFEDLTGADVAASIDDTGHALLGGDWDLEYQTGSIETDIVFSPDLQTGWTGLLAETVHESYETGTDSLEISSSQSWGQTFADIDSTGTFTVNRISVWLKDNNAASNKTITVYLESSWGAEDLGSATLSSNDLTSTFTRYDFDITDQTLNYSTTYYIRVAYSANGKVFVETDSTGTYTDGDLLDNGTAQIGQDMKFRIVEFTGNNVPTLTSFAAAIDTTAEDTQVEITFAELAAQGDEADVDGTVDAFVVKAVSSGTLLIGANAGAATPWAAGTNDTIDGSNNAYWTPAADANGTLNAFTAVAEDNLGAESVTPVQAQVTVTAVNDAPVNSVPGAQTTLVNTALVFSSGNGNLISISDVDAGTVEVELTASNGTLTLSGVGGLTFTGGANGTGNMKFTGTIANINAAMDGMSFDPTPAYAGAASLQVVTDDLGNTGIGGTKSDSDTVAITVNATNTPPNATNLNAAETYTEDTPLDLTDIVITDADSANVTATLTLSNPAAGTLSTGTSGLVTSTFAAGVWSASGAIADVNALLAGVTFTPTTDFNAGFSIATSVDDGIAAAVTGTKVITGIPVNDAPTLTSFSAVIDTTAEDTQVEITFAELAAQGNEADVDGTVDAFVVKAVSSGTLLIGANAGSATPWAAVTNDTIDVTNNAYWTPATDATGTLNAFTAVAEDNSGAESVTPVQAQVTVTAVNDAPTASNLNAGETYTEGTTLNLTDIVVSDVDSATVTVTLTLSDPAAGTLSTGTSGAVTSTFAGGGGLDRFRSHRGCQHPPGRHNLHPGWRLHQ